MCEITSAAVARSVSRRSVLTGAAAGAVAAAGSTVVGAASTAALGGPALEAARGYRTKLVLLGTAGGPTWWPRSTREGIASALVVEDCFYLIDAGEGVGRQVRRAELGNWQHEALGPLDALRGIFLTHLHSDHVCDLSNLLSLGLANGIYKAEWPVHVFGPGNRGELPPLFGPPPQPPVVAPESPTPGTRDMWRQLVRAFATDFNDRAFDNRLPVPDQYVRVDEVRLPDWATADPNGNPHPRMDPVFVYEDNRVRVTATLVQHAPVFPALAYRFDTDDGSVVFSGDTGPSDNLVQLAQGADVLVHEVIAREWAEQLFPEPRDDAQEAALHHLIAAHTVIEDVGTIAERTGVETLVLSHLVPGNWPEHKWLRAQRGFSGRLVVGRDLDQIGIG